LDLSEFQLGVARPDLGNESKDQRTFSSQGTEHFPTESGSDHDILFDDLSVPPNPLAGASSVIIGMRSGGKFPTDSDILVVPEITPGASDSDVRMAPDLDEGTSGSDVRVVPDLEKGTSGSDVRLVPDKGKRTSGSDVRLVPDKGKGTSGSDVRLVALDSDAIPTPPDLSLRQVSDS